MATTFRAAVDVTPYNAEYVAALRPPPAPSEVSADFVDTNTLHEVGVRLRDALGIPEAGYPPDVGYNAYLETTGDDPWIELVSGYPANGSSYGYVPFYE